MKILNKIGYLLTIMAFGIELFCKGYITQGYVINPEEHGVWKYYYWDVLPLVNGYFNPILIMLLTLIIIVLFKQQLKVNNISLILCNATLSILIIMLSNDKYKFLNCGSSDLFKMSDESPIILIFMMVFVLDILTIIIEKCSRINDV